LPSAKRPEPPLRQCPICQKYRRPRQMHSAGVCWMCIRSTKARKKRAAAQAENKKTPQTRLNHRIGPS
jgi:hypothetical protein